jgi:flagellar hook-basal body complex protein FliE
MTAPIGGSPGMIISPFERAAGLHGTTPTPGASAAEGGSFSELLGRAMNDASDIQDHSKDMIGAFLRGEPVELHQVMAASEEAAISLELLVEMRNKLTDAYRTVMNVQT